MAIIKEVYSSTRVNLIYQLLRNEADNGTPKEYDVRVDDLKVVSRTSDPERFHGHEEFVLPETRSWTIVIIMACCSRIALKRVKPIAGRKKKRSCWQFMTSYKKWAA